MEIQNKVALVTGGAVRLGRAICLELSQAGAHIFCQYHSSQQQALSLKKEIESSGGKIELFQIDLTSERAVEKIKNEALSCFGKIDILVNNSAVFYPTPLGEITEQDWSTFHELNLKAAFFLSQEIGMWMKNNGSGRIISIGDTTYSSPWPSFMPYALTKAGINAMTKGLAKALAPNVLVNCVNPGPVLIPENYTEEQRHTALQRTVLKREGTAEDIAKTVRFLVEADYITGASIPVDGGRHIG